MKRIFSFGLPNKLRILFSTQLILDYLDENQQVLLRETNQSQYYIQIYSVKEILINECLDYFFDVFYRFRNIGHLTVFQVVCLCALRF